MTYAGETLKVSLSHFKFVLVLLLLGPILVNTVHAATPPPPHFALSVWSSVTGTNASDALGQNTNGKNIAVFINQPIQFTTNVVGANSVTYRWTAGGCPGPTSAANTPTFTYTPNAVINNYMCHIQVTASNGPQMQNLMIQIAALRPPTFALTGNQVIGANILLNASVTFTMTGVGQTRDRYVFNWAWVGASGACPSGSGFTANAQEYRTNPHPGMPGEYVSNAFKYGPTAAGTCNVSVAIYQRPIGGANNGIDGPNGLAMEGISGTGTAKLSLSIKSSSTTTTTTTVTTTSSTTTGSSTTSTIGFTTTSTTTATTTSTTTIPGTKPLKLAITSSSNVIDTQQSITLTAKVQGGTPKYKFSPYTTNAPNHYYEVSGNTITFNAIGSFTVFKTVTDSANNVATASVNVIVEPVITGLPASIAENIRGNTVANVVIGVPEIGYITMAANTFTRVYIHFYDYTSNTAINPLTSNSTGTFATVGIYDFELTGNNANALVTNLNMLYSCGANDVPYIYNSIDGTWSLMTYTTSAFSGSTCQIQLANMPIDPIFGIFTFTPSSSSSGGSPGGGNGGFFSNGGSSTGGAAAGGGGGPPVPTFTNVNNNSCYLTDGLTEDNNALITLNGTTFTVVDNFISPNDTGVSINNQQYTLYVNNAVTLPSSNSLNYSIDLVNLYYAPIEHTVNLLLCSGPLQTANTLAQVPPGSANTINQVPPSNSLIPANSVKTGALSGKPGSGGTLILAAAIAAITAAAVAFGVVYVTKSRTKRRKQVRSAVNLEDL